MFGGQGTQYYQMAADWYAVNATFREYLHRADAVTDKLLGRSLVSHIYRHPARNPFDQLQLTHPAVVMVGYAIAKALEAEGVRPDCVWGSSLGEFTAAAAAGVWSLEAAIAASVEQAAQVVRRCPKGGMLAVLAPFEECQQALDASAHTVAALNAPSHFTVSGSPSALDALERRLRGDHITCARLPVGYAFHSPDMEWIRDGFIEYCAALPHQRSPRLQLVSSMSADTVPSLELHAFWEIARQPIRFRDTLLRLERMQTNLFVDCTPTGTLASFVKNNLAAASQSLAMPVVTPFMRADQNLLALRRQLDSWGTAIDGHSDAAAIANRSRR